MEFSVDLGPSDKDTGEGGRYSKGVRGVFQGGCAGGTSI